MPLCPSDQGEQIGKSGRDQDQAKYGSEQSSTARVETTRKHRTALTGPPRTGAAQACPHRTVLPRRSAVTSKPDESERHCPHRTGPSPPRTEPACPDPLGTAPRRDDPTRPVRCRQEPPRTVRPRAAQALRLLTREGIRKSSREEQRPVRPGQQLGSRRPATSRGVRSGRHRAAQSSKAQFGPGSPGRCVQPRAAQVVAVHPRQHTLRRGRGG